MHEGGTTAAACYTQEQARSSPLLPADDRLYLRGFEAASLLIVADREVHPGRGDCLSDHFGLLATLRLSEGAVPPPPAPQQAQQGAQQPAR